MLPIGTKELLGVVGLVRVFLSEKSIPVPLRAGVFKVPVCNGLILIYRLC